MKVENVSLLVLKTAGTQFWPTQYMENFVIQVLALQTKWMSFNVLHLNYICVVWPSRSSAGLNSDHGALLYLHFSTSSYVLRQGSAWLAVDSAKLIHEINHHKSCPGTSISGLSVASLVLVNSEIARTLRAQSLVSEGIASKMLLLS